MTEARLEYGIPQTAGWFVVNAADVPWEHDDLRSRARFGGEGEAHFDDVGVALYWLRQGQATALYHHEAGQEDFLVLRGRPLLIADGTERELRPLDLVHCPPRTGHTIVNPHPEPALLYATGHRKGKGSARYPADGAAARHGASVAAPVDTAAEAYVGLAAAVTGPAPDGLTPG